MRKSKNRISPFFGFSYLDAILLLVVGLILSVGIYIYTEEKRQETDRDYYRLEIDVCYEEELLSFIPQKDQRLFDGEGRAIGHVEEVLSTEDTGRVIVTCLVEKAFFSEGETFVVETSSSVKEGRVVSAEEVLNEKRRTT